jgi:hypothetical protein
MNWIKSEIVRAIARHALNAAGAWLVTKGFLTSDEPDKVYGALCVLAAVLHSLWDKRQAIAAELRALFDEGDGKGGASVVTLLVVAVLALAGCKSYQISQATSGTGAYVNMAVPIPYSGGESFLGLTFIGGMWKHADVFQPTTTNAGPVTTTDVAVRMRTRGTANANALAGGVATNGVAGVDTAAWDETDILTGNASVTTTNGVVTAGK